MKMNRLGWIIVCCAIPPLLFFNEGGSMFSIYIVFVSLLVGLAPLYPLFLLLSLLLSIFVYALLDLETGNRIIAQSWIFTALFITGVCQYTYLNTPYKGKNPFKRTSVGYKWLSNWVRKEWIELFGGRGNNEI